MASQQPPARPWFRLPSLSRPSKAPAPAPAPPQAQALPVAQPRPPIIRSTFTQPSPNSPIQPAQLPLSPPTQAPSPLPVAASPPPRAAAPPPAPPRAPTSTPSPNAISSEPRVIPEEFKSTMPPPPSAKPAPPPLAPASQSITAVAPVTITASNGRNHSIDTTSRDGKPDVRKDNGNYKKQSNSEEFGRRLVTLAGENKGAIMEWIPSNKKNSPPGLHKNGGNLRTWSDGEKYGSKGDSSNEEGREKSKDKSYKARTNSSRLMSAFMNSNVQGVNNSILYNCSYSHHDPGVHFSLPRKANGHGNGVNPNNKDHANRQNI